MVILADLQLTFATTLLLPHETLSQHGVEPNALIVVSADESAAAALFAVAKEESSAVVRVHATTGGYGGQLRGRKSIAPVNEVTGKPTRHVHIRCIKTGQEHGGLVELEFGGKDSGLWVSCEETRLDFGTADFTVEAWVRSPDSVSGMLLNFGYFAPNGLGLDLYLTAAWQSCDTSNPVFDVGGTDAERAVCAQRLCRDGGYHHIAFVRAAGVLYLYHDGKMVCSGELRQAIEPKEDLFIGSRMNDSATRISALAQIQILNGYAKYSGDFEVGSATKCMWDTQRTDEERKLLSQRASTAWFS